MNTAAIVTVGSELTAGLRVDTNTAEVARALDASGYHVVEALSVADDVGVLSASLARLCAAYELVISTGGLGPTHDDVTREAAGRALGLRPTRDPRLVEFLRPLIARHADPVAAERVMVQADVFEGARVLDPVTGTAPGLIIPTSKGRLVLLPGPPAEMRPMLDTLVSELRGATAYPSEIGVVGMSESDVQLIVQQAIAGHADIGFTVLAKPGDVRVLLMDRGCGEAELRRAAAAASDALGDSVYSENGESLPHAVITEAIGRRLRLAVAESCTGGLVAAALTEIPGSSAVMRGGVVAYDNSVKTELLGVDEKMLTVQGAVSEECALAMAVGARVRLHADIAVSVTGIAGPGGGTADKPVGLVWFGLADSAGTHTLMRRFSSTSRESIRARATSVALDLLRRAVRGA